MKVTDKRVYRHRSTEEIQVKKTSVTVVRMRFKTKEPPVRTEATIPTTAVACQQREQEAPDAD